jgi:hypothetical protein
LIFLRQTVRNSYLGIGSQRLFPAFTRETAFDLPESFPGKLYLAVQLDEAA